MTKFFVSNPRGHNRPLWTRSAFMDDDGTIFAPAGILGNERAAVMLAAWHGDVPMVNDSGHAYLPTRWMAREDPSIADICEKIERRIRLDGKDASQPHAYN